MVGPQEWRAWRLVRVGLAWSSFVVFFTPFGLPVSLFFDAPAVWLLFLCMAYVAGLLLTLAAPDARTRVYVLLSLFCLLCLAAVIWMMLDFRRIRHYLAMLPVDVATLLLGTSCVAAGCHMILSALALRRIAWIAVGGLTYGSCIMFLRLLVFELSLLGLWALAYAVVRSSPIVTTLLEMIGCFGWCGGAAVYFGYAIELMVVSEGVSNMRRHTSCG